jgi:hypothetical protein
MLDPCQPYPSILRVHCYETPAQLLADMGERVIAPAEAAVVRLRGRLDRPAAPPQP